MLSNAFYGVGNGYGYQTGAMIKCAVADAHDAISYRCLGQTAASLERAVANARYAIGNGYSCYVAAVAERYFSNTGYGVSLRRDRGDYNVRIRACANAAYVTGFSILIFGVL